MCVKTHTPYTCGLINNQLFIVMQQLLSGRSLEWTEPSLGTNDLKGSRKPSELVLLLIWIWQQSKMYHEINSQLRIYTYMYVCVRERISPIGGRAIIIRVIS